MTAWLWTGGHLGWPVFAVLVFTALLILAADLLWRLVTMPARRLLAGVLSVWLIGLLLILVA